MRETARGLHMAEQPPAGLEALSGGLRTRINGESKGGLMRADLRFIGTKQPGHRRLRPIMGRTLGEAQRSSLSAVRWAPVSWGLPSREENRTPHPLAQECP